MKGRYRRTHGKIRDFQKEWKKYDCMVLFRKSIFPPREEKVSALVLLRRGRAALRAHRKGKGAFERRERPSPIPDYPFVGASFYQRDFPCPPGQMTHADLKTLTTENPENKSKKLLKNGETSFLIYGFYSAISVPPVVHPWSPYVRSS
jgi:hypothetical protein